MEAYIRVQGDGDYRIDIKFTNDSSEAVEGILAICGGTILCLVLGFVGFILLIVLIIVLIIWRVKKRKPAPMNDPTPAHQPAQNAGQTRSYPQGQPQPQQYPQGQQTAAGQPQYQPDPNVPQYRPDPDRPQPQVFEQGQGTMGQPPR
jgi:predicted lipid-binding transport protein (Tim44 family)